MVGSADMPSGEISEARVQRGLMVGNPATTKCSWCSCPASMTPVSRSRLVHQVPNAEWRAAGSAFAANSVRTTKKCPRCATNIRDVAPSSSERFGSAPASNNAATAFAHPALAPYISAVQPQSSATSTATPWLNRSASATISSSYAATMRDVT